MSCKSKEEEMARRTPETVARQARNEVASRGGSAMDAALAAFDAAGRYIRHFLLKSTAEDVIRRGIDDREVLLRYRLILTEAVTCRWSLREAVARVEALHRAQRGRGPAREARLILRWLRRYAPERWPLVLLRAGAALMPPPAEPAPALESRQDIMRRALVEIAVCAEHQLSDAHCTENDRRAWAIVHYRALAALDGISTQAMRWAV
jgi:hypothetical protein